MVGTEISATDALKFENECLKKEIEHLKWSKPDVEKLEAVLKLAKEYGLQRLNVGNISFEMPYRPPEIGAVGAAYHPTIGN